MWTVLRNDDPNHLRLRRSAFREHQMALITSGCVPFRYIFRRIAGPLSVEAAEQPLLCALQVCCLGPGGVSSLNIIALSHPGRADRVSAGAPATTAVPIAMR